MLCSYSISKCITVGSHLLNRRDASFDIMQNILGLKKHEVQGKMTSNSGGLVLMETKQGTMHAQPAFNGVPCSAMAVVRVGCNWNSALRHVWTKGDNHKHYPPKTNLNVWEFVNMLKCDVTPLGRLCNQNEQQHQTQVPQTCRQNYRHEPPSNTMCNLAQRNATDVQKM
jgi:hypothetical protein